MTDRTTDDADANPPVADAAVADPPGGTAPPDDPARWPGAWFELSTDYGEGAGMLPAGLRARVVGVYPPGTPGVGADDLPSPLLEWLHHAPSGRWVPRTIQFTAAAFRQLFTTSQEPPQWAQWVAQENGG